MYRPQTTPRLGATIAGATLAGCSDEESAHEDEVDPDDHVDDVDGVGGTGDDAMDEGAAMTRTCRRSASRDRVRSMTGP